MLKALLLGIIYFLLDLSHKVESSDILSAFGGEENR